MLESQVGTLPHASAIKNHKPQEQKEGRKIPATRRKTKELGS
jgi:hypothetical protein